jgi:hypothetical protein
VTAGARPEGPVPPEAPALPQDDNAYRAPPAPPVSAMVPEARHASDDGLNGARPAAAGTQAISAGLQPASAEPQAAPSRVRWPWRAAAVMASVLLVAGLGGTALVLSRHGTPPAPRTGNHPGSNPPLSTEDAVRNKAVTWIVHQVSRATFVACDSLVCADLSRAGFPNLSTIGPQSNDPLGVGLVVATAAVRAQFRDRLAVWAPAIIAAFGSGNARIEIRWEYPGGATGYNAVQQAYARARKAADALLLDNSRFTFSAKAQAALRSGQIDTRLPQLLAYMVRYHPVQVVDFGDQSPGGGPASLLRSVDLATPDTAAHLTSARFLRWIQEVVHSQRTLYRPSLRQVTLPTGQTVLRIAYPAPSQLNPSG